jgi:hypothetical protein
MMYDDPLNGHSIWLHTHLCQFKLTLELSCISVLKHKVILGIWSFNSLTHCHQVVFIIKSVWGGTYSVLNFRDRLECKRDSVSQLFWLRRHNLGFLPDLSDCLLDQLFNFNNQVRLTILN